MQQKLWPLWVAVIVLTASLLWAGEAEVLDVQVRKSSSGTYAFRVTVRHGDTGWKHYADKWEVLGPDGTILGTRVLLHPHEDEQPFTRSLADVRIPDSVKQITVRVHDKVHGWGSKRFSVTLP